MKGNWRGAGESTASGGEGAVEQEAPEEAGERSGVGWVEDEEEEEEEVELVVVVVVVVAATAVGVGAGVGV